MKNIEILHRVMRKTVLAIFILLTVLLASGSLSTVLAQGSIQGEGSDSRAIERVQEAVRQRIMSREGRQTSREARREPTVRFHDDAQTIARSRTEVRVRGTGTFLNNADWRGNDSRNEDSRNPDSRNPDLRNDDSRNPNARGYEGRARAFWYEATVSNRAVSGIRYDWRGGWTGMENNTVGGDRRPDNDRGYEGNSRPRGRVSYSGPIMNRNSNKAMDVTERGMQDGDQIQQWSYAEQPNQNWDVIDLGNGEVAILSRHSGKAITVQGGRDHNGANIIQRGWNDTRQQRWRLEKINDTYYRIISVDNGKCLDVTERGREDGAQVQLWDYANQSNQQWRLRR